MSVGVVLLGLELDTRLMDDPKIDSNFTSKTS